MQGFRIKVPRGSTLPPRWRTRFRAIETELNDPESDLRRGLDEADRLAQTDGELAVACRLEHLQEKYADLFPGEAGLRLLRAILCDTEPFLWERDTRRPATLDGEPTPFHTYYARRNVFDDPVPPYAPRSNELGRERSYRARTSPQSRGDVRAGIVDAGPEFERLRDMMEGDIARRIPPLTYRQMAKRLRITSTQLHKELYRLKHRSGLTWIRNAKDQAFHANVIAGIIRAANAAEN